MNIRVLVAAGDGVLAPPVGETTVKTHVSRVLTKLGVRSRVPAAILAQEYGLVDV